jgi:hypothetical protein
MNPEHVEFFRYAVYGTMAHFLDYAHPVVWINNLFTYTKVHYYLREFTIIAEDGSLSKERNTASIPARRTLDKALGGLSKGSHGGGIFWNQSRCGKTCAALDLG